MSRKRIKCVSDILNCLIRKEIMIYIFKFDLCINNDLSLCLYSVLFKRDLIFSHEQK